MEESDSTQQSEPICEAVNQIVKSTPEPIETKPQVIIAPEPSPVAIVGNGNEESSEPSGDEDSDDVSFFFILFLLLLEDLFESKSL